MAAHVRSEDHLRTTQIPFSHDTAKVCFKAVLPYRSCHNSLGYEVPIGPKVSFKVQRNFILVRLKVNLRWTYIILRLFYVILLRHL